MLKIFITICCYYLIANSGWSSHSYTDYDTANYRSAWWSRYHFSFFHPFLPESTFARHERPSGIMGAAWQQTRCRFPGRTQHYWTRSIPVLDSFEEVLRYPQIFWNFPSRVCWGLFGRVTQGLQIHRRRTISPISATSKRT